MSMKKSIVSICVVIWVLVVGCSSNYIVLSENLKDEILIEMVNANECGDNNSIRVTYNLNGNQIETICKNPASTNDDYESIYLVKNKDFNRLSLLVTFYEKNKLTEITSGDHLILFRFNGDIVFAVRGSVPVPSKEIPIPFDEEYLSMIKDKSKLHLDKMYDK